MYAREHQLSGQGQLGRLPRDRPAQVQLPGDEPDGIIGRPRRHLHHDVRAEYVRAEEHPEDIVDEKSGEEQRRNFERREADEGDERDAQAHSHRVHQ